MNNTHVPATLFCLLAKTVLVVVVDNPENKLLLLLRTKNYGRTMTVAVDKTPRETTTPAQVESVVGAPSGETLGAKRQLRDAWHPIDNALVAMGVILVTQFIATGCSVGDTHNHWLDVGEVRIMAPAHPENHQYGTGGIKHVYETPVLAAETTSIPTVSKPTGSNPVKTSNENCVSNTMKFFKSLRGVVTQWGHTIIVKMRTVAMLTQPR